MDSGHRRIAWIVSRMNQILILSMLPLLLLHLHEVLNDFY